MTRPAFIVGWGRIDRAGAAGVGGVRLESAALLRATGSIRWPAVLGDAPDRFGRLDTFCRTALLAAALARPRPSAEGESLRRTALVFVTSHGVVDTDVAFIDSIQAVGGASPALFPLTLTSTAMGLVSMQHRITGPGLCLPAGRNAGALMVAEALRFLAMSEADHCLCLYCDAVSREVAERLRPHGQEAVSWHGIQGAALMLTNTPPLGPHRLGITASAPKGEPGPSDLHPNRLLRHVETADQSAAICPPLHLNAGAAGYILTKVD